VQQLCLVCRPSSVRSTRIPSASERVTLHPMRPGALYTVGARPVRVSALPLLAHEQPARKPYVRRVDRTWTTHRWYRPVAPKFELGPETVPSKPISGSEGVGRERDVNGSAETTTRVFICPALPGEPSPSP